MQPDTGALPSENRALTDDQLSFWSRRGFLLLKDFIGPERLRALSACRGSAGALHRSVGLTDYIRQLAGPVSALVGDEPELVRIGATPRVAAIGREVWKSEGKVAAKGAIAMAVLSSSNACAREVVFYPQSHLIPAPPTLDERADADMQRVAEELRSRGLSLHSLSCKAGDVWLRHPMLVCGRLDSGRAVGPAAQDLEAVFCRKEDLPTDRVRQGLAGVLGDRKSVARPGPDEAPSDFLEHTNGFAADPQTTLRQTTTDGITA